MSLYNSDDSIYGVKSEETQSEPANDASSGPSPEQAVTTTSQPAQVLPPAKPEFPFGWAIVGACVFAVIWAASMDGEK